MRLTKDNVEKITNELAGKRVAEAVLSILELKKMMDDDDDLKTMFFNSVRDAVLGVCIGMYITEMTKEEFLKEASDMFCRIRQSVEDADIDIHEVEAKDHDGNPCEDPKGSFEMVRLKIRRKAMEEEVKEKMRKVAEDVKAKLNS